MRPTPKLLLIGTLTVIASSCASEKINSSGDSYTGFDAWRTSTRIAPFAAKGSVRALHDLFLATYTRASDPYLGGEDLEQMCSNLSDVASSIGDEQFAAGLKLERAEVINSVRVIGSGCLASFPRTTLIISNTPKIKLPIEYSSDDIRTPLMNALMKQEG